MNSHTTSPCGPQNHCSWPFVDPYHLLLESILHRLCGLRFLHFSMRFCWVSRDSWPWRWSMGSEYCIFQYDCFFGHLKDSPVHDWDWLFYRRRIKMDKSIAIHSFIHSFTLLYSSVKRVRSYRLSAGLDYWLCYCINLCNYFSIFALCHYYNLLERTTSLWDGVCNELIKLDD